MGSKPWAPFPPQWSMWTFWRLMPTNGSSALAGRESSSVRQNRQELLHPSTFGWHNVRCPSYVAQDTLTFPPDARAMKQAQPACLPDRPARLVGDAPGFWPGANRSRAAPQKNLARPSPAGQRIFRPRSDAGPENASGIISSSARNRICTPPPKTQHPSYRHLPPDRPCDRQYLRLSPHFYNTDEELHSLLKLL